MLEQYEKLQFEGDLLTQYFNVYKMIGKKKTLIVHFFLPKPTLGTHTVDSLSFRLGTSLGGNKISSSVMNTPFLTLLYINLCYKKGLKH